MGSVGRPWRRFVVAMFDGGRSSVAHAVGSPGAGRHKGVPYGAPSSPVARSWPGAGRRKGVPYGAILLSLIAGCGSEPDEAEHPGKAVYQRYCYACHQAGIADAPKLGDTDAWAPRLQKSRAELVENVMIGMPPGMPPRAGCASCSDEELEAAVDFMVLRAQ